ncbi:MAG TPA: helix-turn-helix domain-containing protein [Saprospiraceae bacterium]|nr:helix-turn-helix domain-containing protein [Saprospiraceae bacterium]HNT21588.1 helix-turn-helix domain-containing protein [Saprospiraceae bacterium]
MYKSVSTGIRQVKLDTELYKIHKEGKGKSDFGMDNSSGLIDHGFGLYSTRDVKKKIEHIKTEYFRISLTRQGSARFDIGLEKYRPVRNWILFGIPGQIFSLYDVNPDFLAYYMLFTEKFISSTSLFANKTWKFPFLNHSGVQCFELKEETASEIEKIIFKINDEVRNRKTHLSETIKLYIQLILIHASRDYDAVQLSSQGSSNPAQNLFFAYLKLVSRHFLTVRKVAEYADLLHVSPDHLNRAVKTCSDKTARDLIDEMLLMEAKVYLLHSQSSVSEIAYKLEFADPPHFNRFFKKMCRQTPLEFRNASE